MNKKTKKGFTLVELLVVIAILAILATVSVVGYTSFINKANMSVDEQFVAQMNTIVAAEAATTDLSDIINVRNTLIDNGVNSFETRYAGNTFVWIADAKCVGIWDTTKNAVTYPENVAGKYNREQTTDLDDAPVILVNGAKETINLSTTNGVKGDGCDGVFYVQSGSELTIDGNGTVAAVESPDNYAMAVWAKNADTKVVINSGNFEQIITSSEKGHSLIYASDRATVEINGGTFKASDPQWTLNLADNSGASILVKGGRFYKFNPADAKTEPAVNGVQSHNFVAEGHHVVQDGDWYEVVAD